MRLPKEIRRLPWTSAPCLLLCWRALGASDTHSVAPLAAASPRTIVVTENGAPPVIRSGLLQSTLIVLPEQEKVATVFGGDTVSWVFDGGHVPSRFISIKPKVTSAATDVHI